MRSVSLNIRDAHDAGTSAAVEVALIIIEHPELEAAIRLSTDPTERLSADPLIYGTRSRWMGTDPATQPFQFILASADLPSDLEDAPAATTLVLQNLDARIAELLRSFTDRPTVHMAIVLSDTPDVIEAEFRDMVLMGSGGNVAEIRIDIGRAPIEDEMVPMGRFTKDRFPGLFA